MSSKRQKRIGQIMCICPWGLLFWPFGVPAQLVGLAIQFTGFPIMFHAYWRMRDV